MSGFAVRNPYFIVVVCLLIAVVGVTSLVRSLGLSDPCYYCLLHFFHSSALPLASLTAAWLQTVRHLLGQHRRFIALADKVHELLGDGLPIPDHLLREGPR